MKSATISACKNHLYIILINISQLPATITSSSYPLQPLPRQPQAILKYLSRVHGTFLVLIDGKNDDPKKILYHSYL